MNVRIMRTMYAVISLAFFLSLLNGCAQQKFNVVDAEKLNRPDVATIQSLKVSDDGSTLEIVADRDVVHTYYQTLDPPKVVIDLSQTDPGAFTAPMDVAKGNIKRIEVAKRGSLSRIEIYLVSEGKFALNVDPVDKRKLLATFGEARVSAPAAASVSNPDKVSEGAKRAEVAKTEEVKPIQVAGSEVAVDSTPSFPAPAASASEKPALKVAESAAVQPVDALNRKIVSLSVVAEGVEITVAGGVDIVRARELQHARVGRPGRKARARRQAHPHQPGSRPARRDGVRTKIGGQGADFRHVHQPDRP